MYNEYPVGLFGTTRTPTFPLQYLNIVEIDNNLIWLHECYMGSKSIYMLLPEKYIGSKKTKTKTKRKPKKLQLSITSKYRKSKIKKKVLKENRIPYL